MTRRSITAPPDSRAFRIALAIAALLSGLFVIGSAMGDPSHPGAEFTKLLGSQARAMDVGTIPAENVPTEEPTPPGESSAVTRRSRGSAEFVIQGPGLVAPGTFATFKLANEGEPVVAYTLDGVEAPERMWVSQSGKTVKLTHLPGSHVLEAYGAIESKAARGRVEFRVGEPQPPPEPKPLAELVTKEQAEILSTWYRATISVVPDIETPDDFHAVHASQLRKLSLDAAPYAAEVAKRFEPIGTGTGELDRLKLVACLEGVVRELGAPVPPGPEPPGPTPPPVPVAGLRVLIVEESLDRGRLPVAQLPILSSKAVRDYVESHGGQLRIIDDDSDPSLLSSEWQAIRAAVKTPSPSWAVYTATGGKVEPLPASVDEALNTLQRTAP